MNIYVYGTGCAAGDLADTALPPERITAFVDRRDGGSFLGRPVIRPEALSGQRVDLLIVSIRASDETERELLGLGIDPDRILYLKNHCSLTDRNRNYEAARSVLGERFVDRLLGSERLIRVPLWTETEAVSGPGADSDYVRLKTLEALCLRLQGIPGAVAELGVYRGAFARWLNSFLPERRLYLFDTFSGFDETEARGYGEGFLSAHRRTAIRQVLRLLPHPELAVIREGLFPESAAGMEDEHFALVSLDVDLEESSYAGLCWFLPRIVAGGFLLLHDWNNPRLPGVKRALDRYERESGRLPSVPLCDVNGTLVICKTEV